MCLDLVKRVLPAFLLVVVTCTCETSTAQSSINVIWSNTTTPADTADVDDGVELDINFSADAAKTVGHVVHARMEIDVYKQVGSRWEHEASHVPSGIFTLDPVPTAKTISETMKFTPDGPGSYRATAQISYRVGGFGTNWQYHTQAKTILFFVPYPE